MKQKQIRMGAAWFLAGLCLLGTLGAAQDSEARKVPILGFKGFHIDMAEAECQARIERLQGIEIDRTELPAMMKKQQVADPALLKTDRVLITRTPLNELVLVNDRFGKLPVSTALDFARGRLRSIMVSRSFPRGESRQARARQLHDRFLQLFMKKYGAPFDPTREIAHLTTTTWVDSARRQVTLEMASGLVSLTYIRRPDHADASKKPRKKKPPKTAAQKALSLCKRNMLRLSGAIELYDLDRNSRPTSIDAGLLQDLVAGGYLKAALTHPGDNPDPAAFYYLADVEGESDKTVACKEHGDIQGKVKPRAP